MALGPETGLTTAVSREAEGHEWQVEVVEGGMADVVGGWGSDCTADCFCLVVFGLWTLLEVAIGLDGRLSLGRQVIGAWGSCILV